MLLAFSIYSDQHNSPYITTEIQANELINPAARLSFLPSCVMHLQVPVPLSMESLPQEAGELLGEISVHHRKMVPGHVAERHLGGVEVLVPAVRAEVSSVFEQE